MNTSGIYVSPNQFVEFGDETPNRKSLSRVVASREEAWDFHGLLGLLPDPDPVLIRRGDGAEILDTILADPKVTTAIQTRKLGTMKREWKWQPGVEAGRDKAGPAAKKLCEKLLADLEKIRLYDLISEILDAPYFGMAPVEIHWSRDLRITKLRGLPHRWFGFSESNEPKFISRNNPWEGEELPFGKFIIARHFPTYDNPYGLRLLSRCFWPVMFKKGGIRFWIKFVEKYAMPFLVGRYRHGALPGEQAEMLGKLASMVQDAVAVIPEGSTVEMLGSGDKKGSSDLYKQLYDTMNSEIAQVIMGQTLTAEIGDKGSYGASKTHENVLDDYRRADQQLVKTTMEEVAGIYGQVNAPGVPAPTFSWFEEEDAKKDFANRDKVLTDGGLKLTESYYIRRYGFLKSDIAGVGEEKESLNKKADFSEIGFVPEQQAVEDLADAVIPGAADGLKSNEELFIKIIEDSGSFDEAMQRLLEAWPALSMDDLAARLETTMLNAELFGRWTVENEND